MKRHLLAALIALIPGTALAQGAVFQYGAVVPGHPAVWGGNGSIGDGGATIPLLTLSNTWTQPNTFSDGITVGGTLGAQFHSLVPSTFSSTVGITGNTTIGGTLGVTGATTLSSATMSGALASSGASITGTWGGSPTVSGNWTFLGSVTLDGSVTLSPAGNLTVGGNLAVTGTSALGGGGSLAGTFSGTPTLSGAVTLSGTPSITNGAALTGIFSGTPSFTGAITLSGTPSITSGASLAGTFSGTPTFTGALTLSGTPSITNGAALAGTLSGTPTASGAWTFSASGVSLTANGNAIFGNTTTTPQITIGSASTPTSTNLELQGPSATVRETEIVSGTSLRWAYGVGSTTESGGNAGSNFFIQRFNDAGSSIDSPVTIIRSTGGVQFGDGSLTLGTVGATPASLVLANATSGTITLAPVSGALGSSALTVPAVSSTIATLAAQTFAGTQTFADGSTFASGGLTLNAAMTFQTSSTGAGTQTFTNSPCSGLTSEKWMPVKITGQTGTWFVPACQ